MRRESQSLKGHLDVLLLATLEDGPRHGYAVKDALREGSGGRVVHHGTGAGVVILHLATASGTAATPPTGDISRPGGSV